MQSSTPKLPPPDSIAAIIPAAGSGERFGSHRNKLFAVLGEMPLWYHAASRLATRKEVGRVVMAVSESDRHIFNAEFGELIANLKIEMVIGGQSRTDSVQSGLNAVAEDQSIELVAVHDAARPLVTDADLTAVFAAAWETKAAILAAPVSGTIKRGFDDSRRSETVDRRELWTALTPQVFGVGLLTEAYQKHNGRGATDDAQLVERIGHAVALVRGSSDNLKITFPEDLPVAEAILARQMKYG